MANRWWRLTPSEMGELWDAIHDARYSKPFTVQYDPGENFWYVLAGDMLNQLIDPATQSVTTGARIDALNGEINE